MAPESFVLKHFYYGQNIVDGKTTSMGILARSDSLTTEQITRAVRTALVPPIPRSPINTWTVARTEADEYLLVGARVRPTGNIVMHYIFLPITLLAKMGANFGILKPLLDRELPSGTTTAEIPSLTIEGVQAASEEDEIEMMLELMMFTRNQMNTIENLLSALVRGIPLVILKAPEDIEQRLLFTQGLLMMLPPSVRYAVTFCTHSTPVTGIDVQLRFISSSDVPPDGTLTYDWATAKFTGKVAQDEYSRFIVQQLRLDAEIAIHQARALTHIATWRVNKGDKLADAMAYAAKRIKIDDSVVSNQPVEVATVAQILADDPTLTDELRLAYGKYIVNFSLAIGELRHIKPLGLLLRQHIELSQETYQRLKSAITPENNSDILDVLTDWLSNPIGPEGQEWVELIHETLLEQAERLVAGGDAPNAHNFIQRLNQDGVVLGIGRIAPQLTRTLIPLVRVHGSLAVPLIQLGIVHLSDELFPKFLRTGDLQPVLPEGIRQFNLTIAQNVILAKSDDRIILRALQEFDDAMRLRLLPRLANIAYDHKQLAMLASERVLKGLTLAANSPWGDLYQNTFKKIVYALSNESLLKKMETQEAHYLLRILLSIGAFDELIAGMRLQQTTLYGVEKQTEFALVAQQLFAEAKLNDDQAQRLLKVLYEGGIKSLPLLLSYIGLLSVEGLRHNTYDEIVDRIMQANKSSKGLAEVMPSQGIIALFSYFVRVQRDKDVADLLELVADVSARHGIRTAAFMAKAFKSLEWGDGVKRLRGGLLRRYIRQLDSVEDSKAVEILRRELGNNIGTTLQGVISVKVLLGNIPLEEFIDLLKIAVTFLRDTGEAYAHKEVPSTTIIMSDLDSMPGSFTAEERKEVSRLMMGVASLILKIHAIYSRNLSHTNPNQRILGLLQGRADPSSALEYLWLISGFIGEKTRTELALIEHSHPLPSRSANALSKEIRVTNYLLESLNELDEQGLYYPANAILSEIDSLWQDLPSKRQQQLKETFAQHLQYLVEFIALIGENGDPRALDDSPMGKRLHSRRVRPKNTIEFYRFMIGYFDTEN